jgi:tetratricopeptide (TPR) repeat protein
LKKSFLILFIIVSLLMPAVLSARDESSFTPWYLALREKVYERDKTPEAVLPIYRMALEEAQAEADEAKRNIMLSRAEYMMGRAYQQAERKDEAAACYDRGLAYAEASRKLAETDEAWQMMAENLSQACAVKPVTFAIAYGLRVEDYAKKGLALNPMNAACLYIASARFIFAPAPFYNYKKGIRQMEEAIKKTSSTMHKDDRFNFFSAIGYALVQQKKYDEARPYLDEALRLYPTNQYALDLLQLVKQAATVAK